MPPRPPDCPPRPPPPHRRRRKAADSIALRTSELEERAAQASYYLPPYEQRSCAGYLHALRGELDAAKAEVLPQRKFAFGKGVRKTTASAIRAPEEKAWAPAAQAGQPAAAPPAPAGRVIGGQRGGTVTLPAAELEGADLTVQGVEGCDVVLAGSVGALRLVDVTDCRVLGAAVQGSVFVEGCRGGQLFLAARQLRIHDAHGVDLYLRCKSKPIIEHSDALRFAPFDQAFPGRDGLLRAAGLAEDGGQWRDVEDFGWIKASQSPNWAVLPVADRAGALPGGLVAALPAPAPAGEEQEEEDDEI